MPNKPTQMMKRRLNVAVALILVLFSIWITINLYNVSIRDNEKYQNLANNQQFRARTITANRGSIYDSKMQILAQSATVYTVFIDPAALKKNDLAKKDLIIDTLSQILEMDKESVKKYAEKTSSYEIVKRKVEKPVADKIMKFKSENRISCIGCDPDSRRYYPQNYLASAVIGFTGYEGHGQYGLEAQYDDYLSGIDGRIISAKDALGADMPYRYEQSFAAQDGNSLVLNIDSTLQFYLERELNKCIEENKPNERACGIIMNAKTGQVLAMSTKPDFDLNNPTEITDPKMLEILNSYEKGTDEYKKAQSLAWERQWKNKAITELYFPGSVFKVITGSSALETKSISIDEKFNSVGSIDINGTKFSNWDGKGRGMQNFTEVTTASSNTAFVQIGLKLGWQNFVDYFKAYGLDSKSGIDLPGEVSSINMVNQKPSEVTLASSAFGQTNKITPMEMITAYAAVINGGKLVTPYVVNRIIDKDGNVVKQFEPQIKRQVISEETSKQMREVLETVCKVNGGSNAYIEGYRIGGKSGTSQKIDISGGKEIYVSSYCGFAPANDPEIIMLVMVDEPTGKSYYGSMVAAPVVRSVFKDALPYLGYLPEYTDEEFEKMSVLVPDLNGKNFDDAQKMLNQRGINSVEKVGSGDTVVRQVPEKGQQMPKTGKVYLYTDSETKHTVTVPDVKGMSLSDANQLMTNAGLNIRPTGAAQHKGAIATTQGVAAGTSVERGSVVEVTFAADDETG